MSLKTLTEEQKGFFDENGYLVIRKMYSDDEMAEMREEFHDLIANPEGRPKPVTYDFMEPDADYGVDPYNPRNVRGMHEQPLVSDYWFNNITDPRVVNVFVDLFGPDIDFHNAKIRNNPPGFTNTQGWHQDWPYERHSEAELAASIIYLDETKANEGATSVIPGTHKQGEWETHEGNAVGDAHVDASNAETVDAKPGDVLFIHVLVVHTAGHNHTKISRHKIINQYKTKAAVDQWGNKCAFAGLPLARGGQIIVPQIDIQAGS